MRKIILTLMACALAATSCNLDGNYSASNVVSFVTNYNLKLYSDDGQEFTIISDETDHLWKEAERLYILFDIQNADYDIVLKDYAKCIISTPTPLSGEEPELGEDPLTLNTCTISGGYINCELSYYRRKDSDFLHRTYMEYKDNGSTLQLFLIHEGNGENPSKMSDKDLETVTGPYCFTLKNMLPSGETRNLTLTMNILNANNEVELHTYTFNNSIRF